MLFLHEMPYVYVIAAVVSENDLVKEIVDVWHRALQHKYGPLGLSFLCQHRISLL